MYEPVSKTHTEVILCYYLLQLCILVVLPILWVALSSSTAEKLIDRETYSYHRQIHDLFLNALCNASLNLI